MDLRDDNDSNRPAYSEDGVDLTLIRWMLSLTPAERLAALQQYVDSVLSIRAWNAEARLPANPANPDTAPH
jgi:hypothetical protein